MTVALPHPPGKLVERVLKLTQPRIREFRFEWHPQAQRVYAIRVGVQPEVGELIAFDIDTHGAAINAVNIWSRGYLTALAGQPLPTLIV